MDDRERKELIKADLPLIAKKRRAIRANIATLEAECDRLRAANKELRAMLGTGEYSDTALTADIEANRLGVSRIQEAIVREHEQLDNQTHIADVLEQDLERIRVAEVLGGSS